MGRFGNAVLLACAIDRVAREHGLRAQRLVCILVEGALQTRLVEPFHTYVSFITALFMQWFTIVYLSSHMITQLDIFHKSSKAYDKLAPSRLPTKEICLSRGQSP